MIHSEHFRTASESIEVRHDNNGNAIWAHFKHGEYVLYPSLHVLIFPQDGERIYISEKQWNKICESEVYSFYELPKKYKRVK